MITQRDLSNEYQHDRVLVVFKKNVYVRVLWTKVASALEGLRANKCFDYTSIGSLSYFTLYTLIHFHLNTNMSAFALYFMIYFVITPRMGLVKTLNPFAFEMHALVKTISHNII